MTTNAPVASQRNPAGQWVAVVPSPTNSAVMAGSTESIVDAAGDVWTITAAGLAARNGVPDTSTWQVVQIAYVKGVIWQENAAGDWYSKAVPLWQDAEAVNPLQGTATLTWKAPTTDINGDPVTVTGYYVFAGQNPVELTKVATVDALTYTVNNLDAGTWYFDVAAYNAEGVSKLSPTVSKVIT